MARLARLTIAGCPHLVVQLNTERRVFEDDTDRRIYLDALQAVAADGAVAIHAWALVERGTLLLATPGDAADLGRFIQRVNRRFVPALNRRQGRTGTLWSQRFRTAPVEPEQSLLTVMRYVEQAPVREGLMVTAGEYSWSSAGHHSGGPRSSLVSEHPARWAMGNTPFEREARHALELQRMLSPETVAVIESALRGGWPIGTPTFKALMAERNGRATGPQPRGRPRKTII